MNKNICPVNGRVLQKHAKKDHREPYTQEPWLDLFCTA